MGQWITLFPLVVTPRAWAVGCSRVRAVSRVRRVEAVAGFVADRNVRGGFGAMLDDVFAGFYAAIVFAAILHFA